MNRSATAVIVATPSPLPARALDASAAMAFAALGGVTLSLALPPADFGPIAFVSLVPLLHACAGRGAPAGFVLGGVFGIVSSLSTYRWLLEVPAIGVAQMALLAAYVALYPALWCAALTPLGRSRVPLMLSAPALWVALDALKANAGFLALPWGTLAHSQHANASLLQIASVTGEAAVSFVVVMTNVVIARAIRRRGVAPELVWTAAAVAALHAGGALRLAQRVSAPLVTVAAIQPALAIGSRSMAGDAGHWQRLETLTLDAARARPVVIVWPETVVRDPQRDAVQATRLASLAQHAGVPLVVGAAEAAKFSALSAQGDITLERRGQHNSAHLVLPEAARVEPYRKRRLVPFAEYQPWPSLGWPTWLVPARAADVHAGTDAAHWTLPSGLRIAPLICWENLFAPLARDAVGGGAQLLVQLTDDAWFGHSAASRQHNLASVLRAVENGVPVVTASNAGPSQIVDGQGRVLQRASALFSPAVVAAPVPLAQAGTPYTRWGDWFVAVAALLSVAALLDPLTRRRLQ